VMIGAGTARADDPDLTVRDLGARHQPVRIVLDSRLGHSPASRLGATAAQIPVWMVHTKAALPAAQRAWDATGAKRIEVPAAADGKLDLTAALRDLAGLGLTRIFCEGGGTLAAALLRESLVDDVAAFAAGLFIGGDGTPAIGPMGLTHLPDAPRLTLQQAHRIGPDTLSLWSADPASLV
jgi:diaminohydroxyphosphoribosylaminopyrimidine deaminase / 5-amino-6-(5-phosphoribosylamino)uracil reductase